MSTIVAIKGKKEIIVGCDSLASYDKSSFVEPRVTPKAFKKVIKDKDKKETEFIIGSVGSFRLMQILYYHFAPPFKSESIDTHTYMVTKFLPILKRTIKSQEFEDEKKVEDRGSWEILVVVGGEIFTIQSDWQVNIPAMDYYALGSGARFAFGSLFTLPSTMSINQRCEMALMASDNFDSKTGGVYHFEKIKIK